MTIGNALNFIKRGIHDNELRRGLNHAPSASELQVLLENESLPFSSHEFEEAFSHLLTQCQEAEEAEVLNEFGMWWRYLSQSFESFSAPQCGSQCSGCSSTI